MPKRRSGLGSLIPGAGINTDGGPELAPVSAIAVNPYQPRLVFDDAALDELAESIRQYGILQPLTVRPREGGYELIAGERRLTAARRAGLREVPVIVRDCGDEEMLMLALVENLQREDLNPVEAARSYKQLLDQFGLAQSDVAERVGKSRSAVANTLRLLVLPENMLAAVATGALGEGHARALLAVEDTRKREQLFVTTVEKGLSVRALEALVQPTPAARPRKQAVATRDAELTRIQEELQAALGVRVRLRAGSTLDHGTIEIEYYTPDDLNRLYDAVTHE
jgi:ParB family transcriptional regulator, chromosome partitioning protein